MKLYCYFCENASGKFAELSNANDYQLEGVGLFPNNTFNYTFPEGAPFFFCVIFCSLKTRLLKRRKIFLEKFCYSEFGLVVIWLIFKNSLETKKTF